MEQAILQTNIPAASVRRGKVRDIYDLGDTLLIAATDRLSLRCDYENGRSVQGAGSRKSRSSGLTTCPTQWKTI